MCILLCLRESVNVQTLINNGGRQTNRQIFRVTLISEIRW